MYLNLHRKNIEVMTDKDLQRGVLAANWAQLVEDNAYFIVPPQKYNVRNDERLLIPIIRNHKIGFVNQLAIPVVEPKYDIFNGNVMAETDFVKVGMRYSYGYSRANGEVQTYDRYKWGLLDSKGKTVLECNFASISISDDKELFSLKSYDNGYCVVNHNGNIVIPYGEYAIIDGFTNGYARVKKNRKYGIVNTKGQIVLPVEYDNIWSFYQRTELRSTRIIMKGMDNLRFNFATGKLNEPNINHIRQYNTNDDYGRHYGEYAGTYAQDVAGYSDDVINDAFDGEPDAYWNID